MSSAIPQVALDDETLAVLDRLGADPAPLYRVLGNQPELLRAWLDFAWTLRTAPATPRRLRELVILRCAVLAGNDYQWRDHVAMAAEVGVPQRQLDELETWRESDAYAEVERAVLALTEEVVANDVTDGTLDEVRQHLTPGELVEVTLTAAFYVMVPRVLQALRVSHDRSGTP